MKEVQKQHEPLIILRNIYTLWMDKAHRETYEKHGDITSRIHTKIEE